MNDTRNLRIRKYFERKIFIWLSNKNYDSIILFLIYEKAAYIYARKILIYLFKILVLKKKIYIYIYMDFSRFFGNYSIILDNDSCDIE